MVQNTVSWKFPAANSFMFRIEAAFVAVLALLIFVGTLTFYGYRLVYPIIFTIIFLVLYVSSSQIIRKIQQAEEHYKGHATHLEITRKRKNKTTTLRVPWKNVHNHKLDKFFLGGYVLTKEGKRHPLFFNTKKEIEKFEALAKKVIKRHA